MIDYESDYERKRLYDELEGANMRTPAQAAYNRSLPWPLMEREDLMRALVWDGVERTAVKPPLRPQRASRCVRQPSEREMVRAALKRYDRPPDAARAARSKAGGRV